MNSLDLIGRVACDRLRSFLDRDTEEFGTARFVLHRLGVEEVAAIATAVCHDPELARRVEVLLPRYRMAGCQGISDDLLTDRSTTELRTAPCPKDARLSALFDDSQEQSLAQVEKINKDLLLDPEIASIWVDEAFRGLSLPITDSMKHQWAAALKGLLQLDRLSLTDAAAYVCETQRLVEHEGQSIRRALGKALWTIRLPSFANSFEPIAEQKLAHASEWKRKYNSHWSTQCYLLKRNKQQVPYSKQALQECHAKVRDQLSDTTNMVLGRFIDAEDGWTAASEELSKQDWEEVRQFFEGVGKPEALTLGERTQDHFRLLDQETISQTDWNYIQGLVERGKRPVRSDEDEQFYFGHTSDIQQDSTLAAMWDRFVFGNEVCCQDLHEGLVECIRRLLPARRSIPGKVVLEITAEESDKIKFKLKNEAACRYFQKRYSGIDHLLSGLAEFRKVLAFRYDGVYEELKDKKGFKPDSVAKKALQLSFQVVLKSSQDDGLRTTLLKLTWVFNSQSVLSGYSEDLDRLAEYVAKKNKSPLVRCHAARDIVNAHGAGKPLSLEDVSGFGTTGKSDRGAFVPALSKLQHLGTEWQREVKDLLAKGFLDADVCSHIVECFRVFEESYAEALNALCHADLNSAVLMQQAEHYGALLRAIVTQVQADVARRNLLRPLLEIGVPPVAGLSGSDPAAVVCPWHPLRLQATAARSKHFRRTIATLLSEDAPTFTDGGGDLFFKETFDMLAQPGSPEAVLYWRGAEPVVLSTSDLFHDYTLHESPVSDGDRSCTTSENPRQTAKAIAEIVDAYLTLQPHERDNFSIVLYNCDSVSLPQAVVESIRSASESDAHDAMCQVILTHTDKRCLRSLYQRIASQEGDDDAFHISESSRDFMARVRINIMVNEAPEPNPQSGQPTDIVFCQDVISRHAEPGWAKASRGLYTFPADELRPHQWSRRREMQRGDRESVVYLACPAQTDESWSYLLAISMLCQPDFALESWQAGFCQVPARKLNFDKEETNRIFQQTHDLGNWVVNFDELLDRRLLRDRNIKVIRYKQSATQGRNLVISSKASDELLRATIHCKLQGLLPDGTSNEQLDALCEKFISRANDISGQLVLRAARRGSSTNELLGLVLSTHLVKNELGAGRQCGCFLLDDYATWLGQTEDRIADLLILAPTLDQNGEKILDVVVTEAKFIQHDQLAAKARESAKQLRESLRRLESAFFGDPVPADQGIWLARLADLLLDGLQKTGGDPVVDISEWRPALHRRQCRICLRGYSHVFVHAPAILDTEGDKYTRIKGTSEGHQECFSRSSVRGFLKLFMEEASGQNTTSIRVGLSGHTFTSRMYYPIACPPEPKQAKARRRQEDSLMLRSEVMPDKPLLQASSAAPEAEGGEPVEAAPAAPSALTTTITVGANSDVGFDPELQRLLGRYSSSSGGDAEATTWLEDVSTRMKVAIQRREMTAKLLDKKLTPNAALLKFQGTDDLTIPKLEAKVSEFKTTDGLEIIAIRPELGKIAISVARPKREVLYLQQVWKRWTPDRSCGNTNFVIAVKEDDNELLFLSPDPHPHTLVAGITNSGKSVLIQNIILGIAATNTPAQAKITIIDPKKGVDYFPFEGLPQLTGKTISTPEDAIECLHGLVQTMHARYQQLREAKVQNIGQYLLKMGPTMPRLWVIHDEFATWMQDESYRDNVTGLVNQLSVEARAAGIYLIFAAQRPDNTVFPMQLRSNLGNRLVLKVDTEGTSEVALGIKKGGAERLLGYGHLAALLGGSPTPIFAQVPFVSAEDLTSLVRIITDRYTQNPDVG